MNKKMDYSHSILATDPFKYKDVVSGLVKGGLQWLHLDFIDYKYTKSFGLNFEIIESLKKQFPNLTLEAHLMVEKPKEIAEALIDKGVNYISFPSTEISVDELKKIKNKHPQTKFGICILGSQKISNLKKYILICDYVLIMTIDKIGGRGESLNLDLLKKSNQVKKIKNILTIADGGLRINNVQYLSKSNFDIVVGGSIINHVNRYKDFMSYFRGLI